MPCAIAPRSIAYSTSPLVGLPSVQRVARRSFRRSAFADVRAARVLRRLAREQDVTVLTPRPTNGRQGGLVGPPQPPAPVGRESWAGGGGGVPRVLAPAQAQCS